MLRLRGKLPPSALSPSGTGKESFKVLIKGEQVILRLIPEWDNSVEIEMDLRTAWELGHALETAK